VKSGKDYKKIAANEFGKLKKNNKIKMLSATENLLVNIYIRNRPGNIYVAV
jgi:hypothetical protein